MNYICNAATQNAVGEQSYFCTSVIAGSIEEAQAKLRHAIGESSLKSEKVIFAQVHQYIE